MHLSAVLATSTTTTTTTTPATSSLSTASVAMILGFVAGLIVLSGVVVILGRRTLDSSTPDSRLLQLRRPPPPDPPPAQGGDAASSDTDASWVRSWIAIALVGGLLVFCAASFAVSDTTLRSSLLGGLVTTAGVAVTFYFSTKASEQAQKNVLQAAGAVPQVVVPLLTAMTRDEVTAVLAHAPVKLVADPPTAAPIWKAVAQTPAAYTTVDSGSSIQVTFEVQPAPPPPPGVGGPPPPPPRPGVVAPAPQPAAVAVPLPEQEQQQVEEEQPVQQQVEEEQPPARPVEQPPDQEQGE
jgi:hypothetical protein